MIRNNMCKLSLLFLILVGLIPLVSAHPPKLPDPFGGSVNMVYSDEWGDTGATIQLHLQPPKNVENVTIFYYTLKKEYFSEDYIINRNISSRKRDDQYDRLSIGQLVKGSSYNYAIPIQSYLLRRSEVVLIIGGDILTPGWPPPRDSYKEVEGYSKELQPAFFRWM